MQTLSVASAGPGPDPASSTTLVERMRAGEPAAFEELVRAHGPRLRAVALRMLIKPEDADDAVQEAFLSALRNLARFEGRSSLSTWLHRITVNAALMKLRSRASAPEREIEELLPEFNEIGQFARHPLAFGEAADADSLRAEEVELVRRCIDQLPEKFRIALLIRDIEGLGNEDLAQALGVSVNAAKIRVHRARQALRTLLEPYFARES